MATKCCIKNCRTNFVKNTIYTTFFNFPRSDSMREVWEKALNITSEHDTLVCSRHFPGHHMQVIRGKHYLKRHAKPELDLKPPRPARKSKTFGKRRRLQPQSKKQAPEASPCLVCSRPVAFLYEFLTDAHAHRMFVSKNYMCGHCLQEFTTYSSLMEHITGIGSDLKFTPSPEKKARVPLMIPRRQYPCSHCGALFETSVARLYHEVTHTATTKEDLCQVLQINPRTVVGVGEKNAQNNKLKKRKRPVKILAEDPAGICPGDAPELAPPSKMAVKVVATSESGPGEQPKPARYKRKIKVLANDSSEVSSDASPAQKQPKVAAEKHNNANTVSGKEQLKSFASLPAHQKRRLLSSVYCNHCDLQFMTLKHLDKHYSLRHPNLELPLELAFEVGSGDVVPVATPCSACVKRTVCVDTLSKLLKEAARDGET